MSKGYSGLSARGGSGSADIARSNKIKEEILQNALNSNIAGIREKAANGTGNYNFKNAEAVDFEDAGKMEITSMRFVERGENTLVHGTTNSGEHIFYANKSSSPEISTMKQAKNEWKQKNLESQKAGENLDITPTTTYNRWLKNNRKKFGNWWRRS